MRPAWFDRDWPWLPLTCAQGHELGYGTVNFTFVSCVGCEAMEDSRGHQSARCRINGCTAPAIYPPGHLVGRVPPQRR